MIYKTIYDPNPSNFKMPKSVAYNGFSNNNANNYINQPSLSGWNFYTIYLKAGVMMPMYQLGSLAYNSGTVNDWNGKNFEHGNWWTGLPNASDNGVTFHTSSAGCNMQYNGRNYGLTVLSALAE